MNKSQVLSHLQVLTSVSQADFNRLYRDTVEAITDDMPWHEVVRCLKKRRAYLLPPNADSETIYRQQDVWTFATFMAALWCYHPMVKQAEALKSLVSDTTWRWLLQYQTVYQALTDYIAGEFSIFCDLVGPHKTIDAQNTIIPEKDHSPAITTAEPLHQRHDFFSWLQNKMNDGVTDDVYRLPDGYLIVIPQALRAYEKATGYHCDLVDIDDNSNLIKHDVGVLHPYCIGNWQQRNTVSGILIKPEGLPALKHDWPINSELQPDPMAVLSTS